MLYCHKIFSLFNFLMFYKLDTFIGNTLPKVKSDYVVNLSQNCFRSVNYASVELQKQRIIIYGLVFAKVLLVEVYSLMLNITELSGMFLAAFATRF